MVDSSEPKFDSLDQPCDPNQVAERATGDERLLQALLQGISPERKKQIRRENSFKALLILASDQPNLLLPHWEYLMGLLTSGNGFSQQAAIYLIAALAPQDPQQRFDDSCETFYSLLDDKSVMVASHVAGLSAPIVEAMPHLEPFITTRLLAIEGTHHEAGRKELVKAYVLEALSSYFSQSQNQHGILEFACQQLNSSSPKARKAAKALLDQWG
jgi:hypothetical protein